MATVSPTALGLHRLVQAVIRARLADQEGQWAQVTLELIDAAFPEDSGELARWPTCRRLLPHLLAVTEHAERLKVASAVTGDLLDRASQYLRSRGQPQEARPLAERALILAQQALEPNDPMLGDRHDELGRVLREAGHYQAARQHLERALAIHTTAYGADDSRVATRHNELGLVMRALGDLAGARTHHERALEIGQAPSAPTTPPWPPCAATSTMSCGSLVVNSADAIGGSCQTDRCRSRTLSRVVVPAAVSELPRWPLDVGHPEGSDSSAQVNSRWPRRGNGLVGRSAP
jgi:tetratricopeptide (TPR) repeat protein